MDLRSAQPFGRGLGRSRRRILLRLRVQLDDLRARQVAGGILGQTHHQHRADREVGSDEQLDTAFFREPVEGLRLPAGRPDDCRNPDLERGLDVVDDDLWGGEIDHRLRFREVYELVARGFQRGADH
jgi:hypothetical protein